MKKSNERIKKIVMAILLFDNTKNINVTQRMLGERFLTCYGNPITYVFVRLTFVRLVFVRLVETGCKSKHNSELLYNIEN